MIWTLWRAEEIIRQMRSVFFSDVTIKANNKLLQLRDEGRTEEYNSLYERTIAALDAWHAAIKAAPEGSPDIPLSDYLSMDEFE